MSVTAASVPSVIGSARSSAHFENATCFDVYPPTMTDELDAVDIPCHEADTQGSYARSTADDERRPADAVQSQRRTYYEDDSMVYMNVSEISKRQEYETIDRRPFPPMPDVNDEPIRILSSGWKEFKTPGGRSYYFHPESGLCQWKPPRTTHPSSAMSASVCIPRRSASRESPATTMSEVFVEMPLRDCNIDEASVTKVVPLQSCDDDTHLYAKPTHATHEDAGRSYHNYGYSSDSTHNAQTMTNSVDSGIGRSSISCKNVGFGLPKVTYDSVPFTTENPNYSPELQVNAPSAPRPTGYSNYALMLPNNHFSATPIRQGPLEKCKLSNNGVKLKKKDWVNAYAFLYSGHLLFYKDQKSAEKSGKHYPTPTDVCDLRGGKLSYVDKQNKDKRRKHVISLLLASDTEYLFCCSGSESEINGWFHALRQTISSLPAAQAYPSVVDGDSLARRPSLGGKPAATGGASQFAKKSSLRQSVKSRLKSGSRDNIDNASVAGMDGTPTRDSIIERLLRFFRSRPSVETLRERGIYRPEPVFGSTLAAICQHDRSLVPRFIDEVTRLIEAKGLDVDGLYRVSGNLSAVQRIRCQIDQDRYEALEAEEDVHVLTGALKLFFRELAEPIFPKELNKEFMGAIREPNSRQRFKAIDELLQKLPDVNKATLRVLFSHLERVAVHSGKNRMQIHNLAIMFGPALFCTDDRPNVKKPNVGVGEKGAKNKKKQVDKKNGNDPPPAEPSQNLAYKMVIYGQIVEFVLNECQRFSIFQETA